MNEVKSDESGLSALLSVGTWVLIPFGFNMKRFCVLERAGDKVLMGKPEWCVKNSEWFTIAELEKKGVTILGHSRYRWWRHLLPWLNDLIFPYGAYR